MFYFPVAPRDQWPTVANQYLERTDFDQPRKRDLFSYVFVILFVMSYIGVAPERAWGNTTCLPVVLPTLSSPSDLNVSEVALKDLRPIGVDEAFIWNAVRATSLPETNGCWAEPTGNFDGQILSVGVQQWNFGQNSLQRLLSLFLARPESKSLILENMKTYGREFFADGCRRDYGGPVVSLKANTKISVGCYSFLMKHQSMGALDEDFRKEVSDLFNTKLMRQIQLDQFVRNISAHKLDFQKYFPEGVTPLDVKWVIDITTQQKGLPDLDAAKNAISHFESLDENAKTKDLMATIEWYEGTCLFSDTEGVGARHGDCAYNKPRFEAFVHSGAWKTRNDATKLLLLTRTASRIATGKSGIYQALCFERRAQIALGCGMVSGHITRCDFFDGP